MSQQVCFNHTKYVGVSTLNLSASEATRNKFLLLIATQFYASCYCWPNCVEWVFVFLGRVSLGYSLLPPAGIGLYKLSLVEDTLLPESTRHVFQYGN